MASDRSFSCLLVTARNCGTAHARGGFGLPLEIAACHPSYLCSRALVGAVAAHLAKCGARFCMRAMHRERLFRDRENSFELPDGVFNEYGYKQSQCIPIKIV